MADWAAAPPDGLTIIGATGIYVRNLRVEYELEVAASAALVHCSRAPVALSTLR